METTSDILREMRGYSDKLERLGFYDLRNLATETLRVYADRIEAAYKRELYEADSMEEIEVDKMDIKQVQLGRGCEMSNNQKLREACDYARDMCADAIHLIDADSRKLTEYLKSVVTKMNAALAEPPRNCDVGTAEEQEVRFRNYCWNHSSRDKNMECQCPIDMEGKAGCKLEWSQMPYKDGGAK